MPKNVIQPDHFWLKTSTDFPFSAGTEAGGWVYCSGQIPLDSQGALVGAGDVTRQTEQVLDNVRAILTAHGGTLADVLKCTVFLTDIRDAPLMNKVFSKYFESAPPARTTVESKLVNPQWLVEIEAIAFMGKP